MLLVILSLEKQVMHMLNLKLKLKTSKRQLWTGRQGGSQTVSQADRQTDIQADI